MDDQNIDECDIPSDICDWDTSNITNVESILIKASCLNQDIHEFFILDLDILIDIIKNLPNKHIQK